MNPARIKAVIIACSILASLFVITTQLRVSTDLGIFLPEPDSKFERLLRHQLDNGASSNIVFIAFTGLDAEPLAEFNKQVTSALTQSDKFNKVNNSASALSDPALEFLEQNRYLLTRNDLSEQFSVDGLKSSLQARIEGLASASAPIEKKYLRGDPTGEIVSLLEEWQGKISRHKRPTEKFGVWFSDDMSRTLIMAEIAADISKLQNQIDAINEIRSIYEKLEVPGVSMIMTGPAAFAVESGEDIRADVRTLTLVAVSLVLIFLLSVYRSIRTVFLIAFPLAAGVVVATACILLLNGQIHGITLAFGITLAGVAVDYPIHLLTGLGVGTHDNHTQMKRIWRTLRLGVLSTVIAYAAFLLSGFNGLQQLGLFTIIGLFSAAIFARWVLPQLVKTGAEDNSGLIWLHEQLKQFGQQAKSLRYLVAAGLIIAFAALTVSDKPILHLNVDSLSPIKDQRRVEGKMLRDDLGFWYGGTMMIASGPDKEAVLQYLEYLEPYLDGLVERNVIEGYDMAAHFLPSVKRQQLRQSQIREIVSLENNLSQAMEDFPFKPGIFDPFLDAAGRAVSLDQIHSDSLAESPIGKKLDSLLFEFEGDAGGVILLHGVTDQNTMLEFADQHDDLYFMHLKTASTDVVARSVDRVALTMIICVVLIYLALAIAFRSLYRPLKIMVPTFSAAVVTAAILVFSGNPLSIFHLISLLLVVGLGLDYALFFNRLPDNTEEWDTTFKALWVCGLTTIMVFGILFFSQTPPLKAIGITVGIGAFLSIVFASMWAATPTKSAIKR